MQPASGVLTALRRLGGVPDLTDNENRAAPDRAVVRLLRS